MGGRGSTRWRGHNRQPLVEESVCLDLLDPELRKALKAPRASGELDLRVAGTGEPAIPIDFELGVVEPNDTRRLTVNFFDSVGSTQAVTLKRVRSGFSSRWLAQCPRFCGRRARKLYFVPVKSEVACWRCAGLTYRSTQQHDKRLDEARRDRQGFFEARSQAPRTLQSNRVTELLISDALLYPPDRAFRGRGWGRKSVTTWDRIVAELRRVYEQRWGFPPEMAGERALEAASSERAEN